MSEWWTYHLGDLLMFSPQTYFRLFELYNTELWPVHIIAVSIGIVIVYLWQRGSLASSRWISAMLAACWLWVAWAFLWQRYAQINLAAHYFAWAFLAEALLLLWFGLIRNKLLIEPSCGLRQRIGMGIFLFALFVLPVLGILFGRGWRQAEIFGMAPDPTALATLGLLLLAGSRAFWALGIIPLLWCLVSGATLWVMDSNEFFIVTIPALLYVIAVASSLLKPTAP